MIAVEIKSRVKEKTCAFNLTRNKGGGVPETHHHQETKK
jgi:hypothetical protein